MAGQNENPPLTAPELERAMAAIAEWRGDPDASVVCPRCETEGLCVIDRSARPTAEWFVLSCALCSLEATIQIPLAPPRG